MARKPQPLGPTSRLAILDARESLLALAFVARPSGTLSKSRCPESSCHAIALLASELLGRLDSLIAALPEFQEDP